MLPAPQGAEAKDSAEPDAAKDTAPPPDAEDTRNVVSLDQFRKK
jgi:hypothetical protein